MQTYLATNMKTYLIPQSFRHSVIEYFDRLVKSGDIEQFFVGDIDSHTNLFHLLYELRLGMDKEIIEIPGFTFIPAAIQLELRESGDIDPIENLKDALANISMGNSCAEQNDAIAAIMDYCEISLSMVDFEDDGHFQVEASLEWR